MELTKPFQGRFYMPHGLSPAEKNRLTVFYDKKQKIFVVRDEHVNIDNLVDQIYTWVRNAKPGDVLNLFPFERRPNSAMGRAFFLVRIRNQGPRKKWNTCDQNRRAALDETVPLVEQTAWNIDKSERITKFQELVSYRIFAFDYECLESENDERKHLPFMIAVTEYQPRGLPSRWSEFVGDDCTERFLVAVERLLNGLPKNSCSIFMSYNGSGYDNIFLLQKIYDGSWKFLDTTRFKFVRAGGRIISISMIHRKTKAKIFFRDSAQFVPAGQRGRLKVLCEKLKLRFQKDDCSVDEIFTAGEMVLNKDYGYEANALYQKVLKYCIRDTECVFEVAGYFSKIFTTIPSIKRRVFDATHLDQEVIDNFGIYYFGMTLANISFFLIPFAANYVPHERTLFTVALSRDFYTIKQVRPATMIRLCINGGRTLAGGIGLILQPDPKLEVINAVDVKSMYPTASMGPCPAGEAFYPKIDFIDNINSLLYSRRYRPVDYFPFVAYVRFRKTGNDRHLEFNSQRIVHSVQEVMGCVPYRLNAHLDLNDPLSKKRGSLQWISHTNGEYYYGFYTCVDIFSMMRYGFAVTILTRTMDEQGGENVWPIAWPRWSWILGDMYQQIYRFKSKAEAEGNAVMKEAYKNLLNTTIGKMALRFVEYISMEKPLKSGVVEEPRVHYQLNAFIMSWKNIIANQLTAFVVTHDHTKVETYLMVDHYKSYPVYSDTDNMIFITNADGPTTEEIIAMCGLTDDGTLGNFDCQTYIFNFRLDPENWHKCPAQREPNDRHTHRHDFLFQMVRKGYILRCARCKALRRKYKGHMLLPSAEPIYLAEDEEIAHPVEEPGFRCLPIIRGLFGQDELALFDIMNALCLCGHCLNDNLYDLCYGGNHFPDSGSVMSFKKILPDKAKVAFGIKTGELIRRIQITVPSFQRHCPICFWVVHQ